MKNGLEEEVDFKDLRLVLFSAGPKFTIQSHVRLRRGRKSNISGKSNFLLLDKYIIKPLLFK